MITSFGFFFFLVLFFFLFLFFFFFFLLGVTELVSVLMLVGVVVDSSDVVVAPPRGNKFMSECVRRDCCICNCRRCWIISRFHKRNGRI